MENPVTDALTIIGLLKHQICLKESHQKKSYDIHPKFGKLCPVSPTILGPEIWHATHLAGPWIRFQKNDIKNISSPQK